MSNNPISLLLVDDHDLIRSGLVKLFDIEDDIDVVGEANDSDSAISFIEEKRPDVVLMDINLGDGKNGLETTKEVIKKFPDTSVVILTVYGEHEYVVEAVKSGAVGYLQKEINGEDIISAVRAVAEGKSLIDPELSKRVFENLSSVNDKLESLTKRETEILDLIADGMSNKEIADKLFISEGTIKNHITSLFRKLDVHDRTQAAILALREKAL